MELLVVSGNSNRYGFVLGRVVWLRKAFVAVLCVVLGHVPLNLLVALAMCIAVLVVVFGGVARAEAPRLIPDGQFESEGTLGVAVDQSMSVSDVSRGDVYVASYVTVHHKSGSEGGVEFVPGRVEKFDASGRLISPPSPFGVSPLSPFGEIGAAGYSGAAVSPVNGDVFALDTFTSEIIEYDPATGEAVGSFLVEPPSGNFPFFIGIPTTVVQIATDSAGNVYVPVVPGNKVLEYDPATCPAAPEPCVPLKTFTGGTGAGALKGPTGVSVDPVGNVWVADVGNERIVELSPTDTLLGEIASEGLQSVAVDGHGDVFAIVNNSADFCGKLVAPCPHLVEYSSTGAQLADLGAGAIGAEARTELTQTHLPDIVAVSDSTGRVFVTEGLAEPAAGGHSRVLKYTPPVAPKLEGELASEVGVTEAKLGALVNPGGLSASYRFEYGTTTVYGNTTPFPEGDTGGGFQPRTVWAAASGLTSGMTYHYRVVVTSELGGELVGEDHTFTTRTAAQANCPNAQFRTGFSAGLPDCRAYELVTPPNETSAQPDPWLGNGLESAFRANVAAVDGNRLAFNARDVFPGSPSGGFSYVATRGASGWSSENVIPSQNYYDNRFCETYMSSYSTDLTKGIFELPQGGLGCGGPEPELVPGEPKGVGNLYLRDNTNGSYQLINMPPPGVTGASAELLTASADLDHVLFRENAQLTSDAPGGVANVYEWADGALHLLRTVLPDGTPVAGVLATPAISRDGSWIFFTYAGGLYAQSSGGGTVQLDASQTGGGAGGGGSLVSVSADSSQVFFLDANRLTADSTAEIGKRDLYRYDFAAGEGKRLIDLTVDPTEPADVQNVRGVSKDGSYVYFEADGVLPGSVANGHGETAQPGQPNLYVWHGGGSTFIATQVIAGTPGAKETLQVAANGAFLAIASTKRLTGYDNTDANTEQPDSEIYLYGAPANALVCASCNPSGQRPISSTSPEERAPRYVSDNGQVFFDSSEALLPADTNGQIDVYEFEAAGVGSCSELVGCVSLLSTGTSSRITAFIDASPSGNDVFLREYQKLVPHDKQEEARTLYDVRVDGGIPEPVSPSPCTTAEACRTAPVPQPPIFGAPPSQTFSGVGNFTPSPPALVPSPPTKCKKGYVKKKGKCVKAKKRKRVKKTSRKGRR
jgi:hypothetical protein